MGAIGEKTIAFLKDIWDREEAKPCWKLNYCPYGELVENMPHGDDEEYRDDFKVHGCKVYGHLCPVYLYGEPFNEKTWPGEAHMFYRCEEPGCNGEAHVIDHRRYDVIVPKDEYGWKEE